MAYAAMESMTRLEKRWAVGIATAHRRSFMRQYYAYILASHSRRLYVGVTNDLMRRVAEHRRGQCEFTSRYHVTRLVHFESTTNVGAAIGREKELKGWVRSRKIALIERHNTYWQDLAAHWFDAARVDPSSLRSSG